MTTFAIVIAMNDYPPRAQQPSLRGAVSDAAAMAEWLLSPSGGDVPPTQLYFWSNPAPPAPLPGSRLARFLPGNPWAAAAGGGPPSAGEIWMLSVDLPPVMQVSGATRLYIYFAGHGAMTRPLSAGDRPKSCFIPGDFYPSLPSLNLICCEDYMNQFIKAGVPEVVLFQDCCRSALPANVPAPQVPTNNSALAAAGYWLNGRSAQPGRPAYEITSQGGQRGAFTVQLLDGLDQRNPSGGLLASDLDNYVTTSLASALSPPMQQTPDFSDCFPAAHKFTLFQAPPAPSTGSQRGPLAPAALTHPPAHPGLEIHVSQPPATPLQLVDSKATVVLSQIGAGATSVAHLPVGLYSLETPDGLFVHPFAHTGPDVTHVDV